MKSHSRFSSKSLRSFLAQSFSIGAIACAFFAGNSAAFADSIVFQRGYVDEQYGFGGSLYMVDPNSTAAAFFFGGGNHPNYSPDGAQVVFVDQDGDLAKTPAGSYTATNLVIAGGGSTLGGLKPKWSPDGTLIVFETDATNANKIVITNAACTSGNEYNTAVCNYTKLDEQSPTVNSDPDWYPAFDSNSTSRAGRVIFVRKATSSATTNDIYATDVFIEANGVAHETGTVNLTNDLSTYEAPSYSHDGTKIIFVQGGSLKIMDADGTNFHPIVSSANSGLIYGSDPSFSPDDSKITWGDSFIYTADLVINSNGSVTARNIVAKTNSSSDRSPSWQGTGGSSSPTTGLSATTLTVNGSANASSLTPDAPIVFEARQTDRKDNVSVKVQYSTDNGATWTNLNTGYSAAANGDMTYSIHDSRYVLTTENYPIGNGISFRAVAKAAGQPDSNSALVGPFNIASNKTHLPPTLFSIEGTTRAFLVNYPGFPLNFAATIASSASGLSVRLQSSTTPEVESSWSDLNDGNSGYLTNVASNTFLLRTDRYPIGTGIYFRVVAAASGLADSISNFVGPFTLRSDVRPVVTITSPSGGTGAGTPDDPLKLTFAQAKSLQFAASGSDSDGTVRKVELLVDAVSKHTENAASASTTISLSQGTHTLYAVATDNSEGKSDLTSLVVQVAPAAATAHSYIMTQSGAWSSASNWLDENGNHGIPGALDNADVKTFTPTIASGEHITVAGLTGGSLSGADSTSSTVTITKSFTWNGGAIANLMIETVGAGTLTATTHYSNFALNSSRIQNDAQGVITVEVDGIVNLGVTVTGKATGSSLNNKGTFSFHSTDLDGYPSLLNALKKPLTHALQGLASITNSGTANLNGLPIDLSSTTSPQKAGLHAEAAPTGFIQEGGVLNLGTNDQSGMIIGNVVVNGGSIVGSGTIDGNLTNNSGLIAPGHSAGVLVVTGDYMQGPSATLALEVGGADANGPDYDQVQIGGTATLDGTLSVRTIGDYTPQSSDTFAPLSYGAVSGNFAAVTSNASITPSDTGVTLSVTGANPAIPPFLNISTRLDVLTNDNVLIGGFIITGNAAKKVIIRGLGPSLPISNALVDPTLELHKPDGSVVRNDNWKDTQQADIVATTIPPSNDKESAIVDTLAPGAYTAIVKGSGNGTGVGLVEVYDLDQTADSTLANISTRGVVEAGDNVMIGGFIVGGNAPAKTLVRAIGPSLTVAGVLPATLLEIHDANGNVLSNDGWRSTQEADIIATTIPPTNDNESAILATLVPGNYTAIVRGKDDATGIAVVEAYNLQ